MLISGICGLWTNYQKAAKGAEWASDRVSEREKRKTLMDYKEAKWREWKKLWKARVSGWIEIGFFGSLSLSQDIDIALCEDVCLTEDVKSIKNCKTIFTFYTGYNNKVMISGNIALARERDERRGEGERLWRAISINLKGITWMKWKTLFARALSLSIGDCVCYIPYKLKIN